MKDFIMKEFIMSQKAFDELQKKCEKTAERSTYPSYEISLSTMGNVFVSPHLPFEVKKKMPKNKLKRVWRWFRVKVLRRKELTETVHCVTQNRTPHAYDCFGRCTPKTDYPKIII
jgi:hypothetical protein